MSTAFILFFTVDVVSILCDNNCREPGAGGREAEGWCFFRRGIEDAKGRPSHYATDAPHLDEIEGDSRPLDSGCLCVIHDALVTDDLHGDD
jgi:hypothetical protein